MAFTIICFITAIVLFIARCLINFFIEDSEKTAKLDSWLFFPMLILFFAGVIGFIVNADLFLGVADIIEEYE